ncbi:MAG: hypothetical protein KGZ83_00575 [Sulfuricella sp.]|nr:hypothetical protein [Sulfuricella sp.]
MNEIFINYRRADSLADAGQLYRELVRHFGEDGVFLDQCGIESGEDFPEVLRKAVTDGGSFSGGHRTPLAGGIFPARRRGITGTTSKSMPHSLPTKFGDAAPYRCDLCFYHFLASLHCLTSIFHRTIMHAFLIIIVIRLLLSMLIKARMIGIVVPPLAVAQLRWVSHT